MNIHLNNKQVWYLNLSNGEIRCYFKPYFSPYHVSSDYAIFPVFSICFAYMYVKIVTLFIFLMFGQPPLAYCFADCIRVVYCLISWVVTFCLINFLSIIATHVQTYFGFSHLNVPRSKKRDFQKKRDIYCPFTKKYTTIGYTCIFFFSSTYLTICYGKCDNSV
jgi:hypothetical protein